VLMAVSVGVEGLMDVKKCISVHVVWQFNACLSDLQHAL